MRREQHTANFAAHTRHSYIVFLNGVTRQNTAIKLAVGLYAPLAKAAASQNRQLVVATGIMVCRSLY